MEIYSCISGWCYRPRNCDEGLPGLMILQEVTSYHDKILQQCNAGLISVLDILDLAISIV